MFLPELIATPAAPADWSGAAEICLWTVPFILLAALFAVLRSSLLHSSAQRVLSRTASATKRARIEPLLARADTLATSAGILEVTFELAFATQVLRFLAGGEPVDSRAIAGTLLIAVPTILLGSQALPTVIALGVGDRLLLWALPTFNVLQMPLRWLVRALEASTRALMRIVGLRQDPASARQIVEGLREVIADSEISGDLDATEREIIGNVMEFRDVSVSAVMTPRTEIDGMEIGEGLLAAARKMAECGHSRVPVYEGSLDTIVGIMTARDVLLAAGDEGMSDENLRGILRPAYFVPETKPVSELLAEFRREKIKLAIVLDEYGGTAGLVTLGDIIQEIVGDIRDEFDRVSPAPIRRFPDGRVEVAASVRVSEVNGELSAGIPEDGGFETLAGFVLARLGHFPKRGETFSQGPFEYTVIEASDRRVIKVSLRPAREKVVA
ncbi:MAG: hemolysin family protein [Planctomycetota bacterium]